jgi:(S)-3,5-dihydroxyphenylglycine transaminase
VTDADMLASASEYGVIWTPMSYFCLNETLPPEIRLSFSYVDVRQIDEGIARLAAMIKSRMNSTASAAAPR